MWFAVKTPAGEEARAKELLLSHIAIVRDAFVPMQGRVVRESHGQSGFHVAPLISGILFADLRADVDTDALRKEGRNAAEAIWDNIKRHVTPRGYFYYREEPSGAYRQLANAHLLTGNPRTSTPKEFIGSSRISDADMDVFMRFLSDHVLETEEVRLVHRSFQELARAHDVVRVLTGPWAGIEGVVVQKQGAAGGRRVKDRHLEVRFGNNYCLSLPNVRRYELAIVRKALVGEKARTCHLWREADCLTAMLQRDESLRDDAGQVLRQLVTTVIRQRQTSMEHALKTIRSVARTDADAQRLLAFATGLPVERHKTTEQTVADFVPAYPIRPFLTAQVGEEVYADTQTLQHRGFKELIIPVSLRSAFLEGARAVGRPSETGDSGLPSASYAFNAHVAVFTGDGSVRRAIVSWGSFFDAYAALSPEQRSGFLQDLSQKGYRKAYALLQTGRPLGCPSSPKVSFTRIGGIGGFSVVIRGRQLEAARALVEAVAPVAVEFWQKERLRSWRQCVQQTVLIDHPSSLSS